MRWPGKLLSDFLFFLFKHSAFVDTNPRYERILKSQGLNSPEDFLALPAIIVSGHPDRHVARVTLSNGPNVINGFLKKEHRVPWRDRLANALAGFGFCSKSWREAKTLRALHASGIRGPEFIAAGENSQGQAFLLVSELEGAVDIRHFLSDPAPSSGRRRGFAQELANLLARMHDAGFYHRDLYAKHILVRPARRQTSEVFETSEVGLQISILDWQRASRRANVSWRKRWKDLAALDASLAENLAHNQVRLTFLRAYLKTTLGSPIRRPFFLRAVQAIRRHSLKLLRRRKIREMRLPPFAHASQQLIWLKGEELCVTREFHEAINGRTPAFLTSWLKGEARSLCPQCQQVIIPHVGPATLVLGRAGHRFGRLWTWIRRQPRISSELKKAALIFRLERYGVEVPKLLAFGQRPVPGGTESFLLTKTGSGAVDFTRWLSGGPEATNQYRAALREAGKMLRRLHDAHCYFTDRNPIPLRIRAISDGSIQIVLEKLDGICKRRRPNRALARENLDRFLRTLASAKASRSDRFRFLLSYLEQRHVTPHAKSLLRNFLPRTHGLPSLTRRASVHLPPLPRSASEGMAG